MVEDVFSLFPFNSLDVPQLQECRGSTIRRRDESVASS